VYPSPSIIGNIKLRTMSWTGHVTRMGEKRNVHRLLIGKLEGKRPLGRRRHWWIDNIKMDLSEIGFTVQVFGNDSNKSKFDSGGNQEETEFW
jgi:hypothetical protein